MGGGKSDLARLAAAYLACLAFAITYLLTTVFGGGGLTAAFRGGVVAAIALIAGRAVIGPVISSILDAMARDQAEKSATAQEDDE